mmetsp:Transcript_30240/g.73605  ORF Transcript_30240/g.73605 Transcript_30240/m.73605 type:complete len:536 (-) Transcript_30240:434-2041(-)
MLAHPEPVSPAVHFQNPYDVQREYRARDARNHREEQQQQQSKSLPKEKEAGLSIPRREEYEETKQGSQSKNRPRPQSKNPGPGLKKPSSSPARAHPVLFSTNDSRYAVRLVAPVPTLAQATQKLLTDRDGTLRGDAKQAPQPEEDQQLFDDVIPCSEVELGSIIGEGAFGDVYRGSLYGQDVAIKRFKIRDTNTKENVMNEVRVMRTLRHPNVVEYLGVVNLKGELTIVTEFMAGGTLGDLIGALNKERKQLRMKKCISFLRDTSRGLSWLHGRGIIHRDLKPTNILLDEDHRRCKIADFGLAHMKTSCRWLSKYDNVGSMCYTAPEVLDEKDYGVSADMFSFGMVAAELIDGTYPLSLLEIPTNEYVQSLVRGVRPSIPSRAPPALADLLRKCWDKNPLRRPSALKAFQVLTSVANGLESQSLLDPSEEMQDILDSLPKRARMIIEQQNQANLILQKKLKEQSEQVIKAQSEAMTLDAELRVLRSMGAMVDKDSGLPALVVKMHSDDNASIGSNMCQAPCKFEQRCKRGACIIL